MRMLSLGLLGLLAALLLAGCNSATSKSVGSGQPTGDAPNHAGYDTSIRHDLNAYFVGLNGKGTAVAYEYLPLSSRPASTPLPVFYLWVRVLKNRKLLDQGAAQVTAISKSRFEVTHFVSKAQMKKDPQLIQSRFPESVREAIVQLAK